MRVLVTGGSRGIGKEICDIFIKKGHDVIAPTRDELDLSKPITANYDKIDILVNNAGVNRIKSILEADDLETMQINYFSPLSLFKNCLPHMQKQYYGRVVNVGSIWVDFAKPGRSSYSASKNALQSLSKAIFRLWLIFHLFYADYACLFGPNSQS